MRNQTLGQLKADLRAELRQSSNPAVAQSADHILVNAIKKAQSFLHAAHAWPHMRIRRDVPLEAGSHLYDWPAEMDYENVEEVQFKWVDRWQPVTLFADDDEVYNVYDTDAGVRSDPVLRYRIISDVQLEVWPIPMTDGLLRIKGLKRPPELSGDAVQCPFDDGLVTLVAAAKCSRSKEDHDKIMAEAMALMGRLASRSSTATNFNIGGAGGPQATLRHRPITVRVVRE